jgi:putative Ca2+/H+ antiporter (TMEM165/GDT1 family)
MRTNVPSSVMPPPSAGTIGNGAAPADVVRSAPSVGHQDSPTDQGPRSPLLARLTGLTSIATVAAAGIVIVGVLAVVGGSYDKQVVHDQLVPQKIFFPAAGSKALLPGVKQYAGQQLVNGNQAKAYANNFINVHLSEIAGGQTYAQVSTAALAAPKNAKLAEEKATLFQGETLRGLLLNAWGWSVVGMIATLAGFILIALGGVLLLLPLANWQVNLRGRGPVAARA